MLAVPVVAAMLFAPGAGAQAPPPPPECPTVAALPSDPAPSDQLVQTHAAREDAAQVCRVQVADAAALRDALRSSPLPVELDAGPGTAATSRLFVDVPPPEAPAGAIGVELSTADRAMIETAYEGVNGTAWYLAGLVLALALGYILYRQAMPRA